MANEIYSINYVAFCIKSKVHIPKPRRPKVVVVNRLTNNYLVFIVVPVGTCMSRKYVILKAEIKEKIIY